MRRIATLGCILALSGCADIDTDAFLHAINTGMNPASAQSAGDVYRDAVARDSTHWAFCAALISYKNKPNDSMWISTPVEEYNKFLKPSADITAGEEAMLEKLFIKQLYETPEFDFSGNAQCVIRDDLDSAEKERIILADGEKIYNYYGFTFPAP